MKIILDECLPKKLISIISFEQVFTVPKIELAGYDDTTLLNELDVRDIDVFITIDGNIEYQQQFINRAFGTIIIRASSSHFLDLLPFKSNLLIAIQQVKAGEIIRVP